jgi:hypothetical protein
MTYDSYSVGPKRWPMWQVVCRKCGLAFPDFPQRYDAVRWARLRCDAASPIQYERPRKLHEPIYEPCGGKRFIRELAVSVVQQREGAREKGRKRGRQAVAAPPADTHKSRTASRKPARSQRD